MTRKLVTLVFVLPALLLAGCEFGKKAVSQVGPRGTGLNQVNDSSSMTKVAAVPEPPYPLTPDMLEGPRANVTYQNVKVLGDLSTEEFNYTMAAITNWIAPTEGENAGCNYCHNPANMASDEVYTKVVARRMFQMTRSINSTWRPHFQASANGENAGVTCWTCHRGNAVPKYVWSSGLPTPNKLAGNRRGQNMPAPTVAYASLPNDPFTALLQGKNNVRVGGPSAYPTAHKASIQSTEQTYGLMMHMSQGLGVNCTYCHNTQNFANWAQSRTQRVSAWYGIKMVRDTNDNYITSLGSVWPANRLGPAGDPKKVYCTTCHQGLAKPLGGYPMLKDYPGLKGGYHSDTPGAAAPPVTAAAPEAEPVPTPVAAADTTKPAA
ncbi:MAG: photosynthetic reaction center cytochrome c subunit [Alphaproteobacteria bacterium]|nr:MAG: photosynthetic reaction center cytochrome c subunit [Alphaproteobacteria bacterium]